MGNQTKISAKTPNTEVSLTHHQSDAPLLPVEQILRLHDEIPERANWVFEQTEKEAAFRRTQAKRRDIFTFLERMFSLVLVVGLCGAAIYVAYLVALAGHEWPAVAIGCTAPIGLFGAFFAKKKN